MLLVKADPTQKTNEGHTAQYLTANQEIFKILKAVMPTRQNELDADGDGVVSDDEFALWLWGKAVEHNANLTCDTVVEFLDKVAPGHVDALEDTLLTFEEDEPATLDSFMTFFALVEWTEGAVDTLRHWSQQEDCGALYFYNTLTHVSTYDNPFQVEECPWEKVVQDGAVFYFNKKTEESQWEKPDDFYEPNEPETEEVEEEEDAWEEVQDCGETYWYNRVTGQSAWKRPKSKKKQKATDDNGATSPSSRKKRRKKSASTPAAPDVDVQYTLDPQDESHEQSFVYQIDPVRL